MGLLSKIKKGFKKVLAGAAKVLNNKWVKGILMATTLIVPVLGMATAGFSAGGLTGALSSVAKGIASKVVGVVTAPIKMIASGGANLAGKIGAEGLAGSLGNFAKSVGNMPKSIFGNIAQDNFATTMQKLTGGANAAANTAASTTGAVADAGGQFGDIAKKVTSEGGLVDGAANAGGAEKGMLGKAVGWIENNPKSAQLLMNTAASMTSPDEKEMLEARYKMENRQLQNQNSEWNSFGNAAQGQADAQNQRRMQQPNVTNENQNNMPMQRVGLIRRPANLRAF